MFALSNPICECLNMISIKLSTADFVRIWADAMAL